MALPTYAGDPTNYPAVVRYVEDGVSADGADTAPTAFDLADRTAFLKAEVDDSTTGLIALNSHVDAIGVLNFPYDTLAQAFINNGGAAKLVYDFAHSSNLNGFLKTSLYAVAVNENSDSKNKIYYSTDLKNWVEDSAVMTTNDFAENLILGSSTINGAVLVYDSTNMAIGKWMKGVSYSSTPTSLVASTSFMTAPQSGVFLNGSFIWGAYDGLNNGIIVSSTNATSVSRQAFGTNGDLNHARGPYLMERDAAGTIAVALGNWTGNFITQNNSFFLTSTDGITWTEHTFPAQDPGHEGFVGLCYNAEQSMFFAAGSSVHTGNLNIYSSPDGLNWTFIKGLATPPGSPMSIASTGTSIAIICGLSAVLSMLYSVDLGATWRDFVEFAYADNSSLVPFSPGKIRAANGRFIFGTPKRVMGSLIIGEQGSVVT